MTTRRRLWAYVLVFAALLTAFAGTGLWHYVDYFIYRAFYVADADKIQLADNILIIDLPYRANDDDNDPTEYRRRLAELLRLIAAREDERPQAVVLDIWISNDLRGLRELTDAIRGLRERRGGPIDVYASFNPDAERKPDAEQLWKEHARELYRSGLTGYGHTSLDLAMGVLSYQPELEIPAKAGTELMWALPTRVAMDMGRLDEPSERGALVLPIGSEEKLRQQTVAFVHAPENPTTGMFVSSRTASDAVVPPLDKKVVVIGSVLEDRYRHAPQAGPQLIAWALNDLLKRDTTARRPLNNATLLVGQTVFFASFTVLVFAVLFEFVTAWQTRPARLAMVSVAISLLTLATLAAAVLTMKYVTPVALTLCAIFLAGVLAWHFAHKFLVTGVAEGSERYDAFISYSRRDADWVVKHVYEPLKALRKPDGSEVTLFFDRAAIGLGEAFTVKYMRAIVDSRFFIPIFSHDYYRSNHTRNEMDIAYKRSVEKKIVILPVVHSVQPVPEIYSHLEYADAQADPQFIEEIKRRIVAPAAAVAQSAVVSEAEPGASSAHT